VLNERHESEVSAGETLDVFLRLEEALDTTLKSVIDDTETSAQSIIRNIRQLHDSARKLTTYLDGTSLNAGDLSKEIAESVAFLVDIGTFVERLPAKMDRDLVSIQAVVEEMKTLSDLTSDVKAISLQSHLLAINAAVEAGRAGSAGNAFKVVADEMRRLAGNSNAMAVRINTGLARAQQIVDGGLRSTITDSSRQLADVSKAAGAIRRLQDNLEVMSQFYKTRFAIVAKHNEDLVLEIAEALGQVQYQDVVRQCIERYRIAAARRNDALREVFESTDDAAAGDTTLPVQLEMILDDFLAEEDKHRHSVRQTQGSSAPLKIELF
jgi:methyl-accepting chemotaxis protein